jgi:hypothetical protein
MTNKTTTTTKKQDRNWALIQVTKETHEMLKAYCDHHGFKISALASNIIKQYIKK